MVVKKRKNAGAKLRQSCIEHLSVKAECLWSIGADTENGESTLDNNGD
jgi:hypothetical protein